MKHKIDPKVDCVFKAILGSEENKNLLIHFLNSVLNLKKDKQIQAVAISNPYNEREYQQDKLSVIDIKAKDVGGTTYQIEIQMALHAGLTSRMLYTWSTIYHSLLEKSSTYTELKPVISIWILNETLFSENNEFHLAFTAYDSLHKIRLSEHFSIHLLQLPLFALNNKADQNLDRWIYFFKKGEDLDITDPPEVLQTKEMRQAMDVLQDFSENEKNYLLYQSRKEAQILLNTLTTEVEKAKREKEKERKEKERLYALLKKAGIDPDKA